MSSDRTQSCTARKKSQLSAESPRINEGAPHSDVLRPAIVAGIKVAFFVDLPATASGPRQAYPQCPQDLFQLRRRHPLFKIRKGKKYRETGVQRTEQLEGFEAGGVADEVPGGVDEGH